MRGQVAAVVFGILAVLCIGIILYINTVNSLAVTEEFTSASPSAKEPAKPTAIETQIRAILDPFVKDPLTGPRLCEIYTDMRTRNALNIQARAKSAVGATEADGNALADSEVNKQVEAEFATGIPGGALPCPLPKYPIPGSTDAEWLDFVNKLPPDFLARMIYMAKYAQTTLGKQANDLRTSLEGVSGKMNTISPNSEGFTSICPPSLETSRRLTKLNAANPTCVLPEDMSPAQIQESVTAVLMKLVSQENAAKSAIQMKLSGAASLATATITDVLPPFDLKKTIADAFTSLTYLKKQQAAAKAGTLLPTP